MFVTRENTLQPVTEEHAVRGRSLITEELFSRLVARIVRDEGIEPVLATRILDQALAFLAAAARHAGEPLSPTALVDIGWHVLILHTKEYAELCQRVAGRFIHHVPDDGPGERGLIRDRTLTAISAAGYAVDSELWTLSATDCGNCHEDGNCSASGPTGDENQGTHKKK
ncbi:hypothetical protein GCM10010174_84740 [Kutzneria viridogrisea]|uniref:Uncharacterized protein n=1 Tax=Kutzneria viridogrisea TaxID=47990 RepID=A0ABR6BC12_9PSEU|nr:hypothetical protein [Kutzneria viridogrisea]